jgi:NitT/TauT family transport system substrate-binding protein
VAASIATSFGDVPWSVYYALADTISRRDGALASFVAGFQRSLNWLHGHTSDDIARALRPRFADVPHGRLSRAIERLRISGVWPEQFEILLPARFSPLFRRCL